MVDTPEGAPLKVDPCDAATTTDAQGNTLTLPPNTVFSSSGKRIQCHGTCYLQVTIGSKAYWAPVGAQGCKQAVGGR